MMLPYWVKRENEKRRQGTLIPLYAPSPEVPRFPQKKDEDDLGHVIEISIFPDEEERQDGVIIIETYRGF